MIIYKIREKKYLEKQSNMMRSRACCLQRRGHANSNEEAVDHRRHFPAVGEAGQYTRNANACGGVPWKTEPWQLTAASGLISKNNTSKAVESPPCIYQSSILGRDWRWRWSGWTLPRSCMFLPFALLFQSSVGRVLCPVANFLVQLKRTVLDDLDRRLDLPAIQIVEILNPQIKGLKMGNFFWLIKI